MTDARFIPACAGNAYRCRSAPGHRTVHPRVCGERPEFTHPATSIGGSSPRVRGTPTVSKSSAAMRRFIPACAGNAPHRPRPIPRPPVHPRVCGERSKRIRRRALLRGSSPRVRGTPYDRPRAVPQDRFIPACAGNAPPPAKFSSACTVHPRVCGERIIPINSCVSSFGSSPRVRGTRKRKGYPVADQRFIPACAGNASIRPTRYGRTPVHPRVCGERATGRHSTKQPTGSSPRVRGTLEKAKTPEVKSRFIPACAGNANAGPIIFVLYSVHPRVCGERYWILWRPAYSLGSSPRVRGTQCHAQSYSVTHRFIPACAGNAPEIVPVLSILAVHPRVCGERAWVHDEVMIDAGSSPRVRGTRACYVFLSWFPRFIPACAGNALARRSRIHSSTVHPRVCGERPCTVCATVTRSGSSPRVRGTQFYSSLHQRGERFIPACAGNALRHPPPSRYGPVHPRVCGERKRSGITGVPSGGSSPRVRGTLAIPERRTAKRRFIPACAGNASAANAPGVSSAVHPRVCGERAQGSSRT